jgi:hypothetical protein
MSFSRQFASQILLTVFGTVSVLGTGLHLLPGCGHSHGPGHRCTAHDHTCHHHAEKPDTESGVSESHSDCAICRFLAIPRALLSPPEVVDYGVPLEPILLKAISQPSLESERIYGARAPPRFS